MRFGGYYIELGLDANGFLSMGLLTVLWFLGIFAFRVGLVFLQLLPQLATLPESSRLSPGMDLLTWQPFLTSIVLAAFLGPITHSALTRAAVIKVYRELSEAADLEQPPDAEEPDDPDEPPDPEFRPRNQSG